MVLSLFARNVKFYTNCSFKSYDLPRDFNPRIILGLNKEINNHIWALYLETVMNLN